MTGKFKGYALGVAAAASYGMNPLFALPLLGAGIDAYSVLFLRYFQDRTQNEVGKRLGLSQVQISRIEKKALLRMRQQGEKA